MAIFGLELLWRDLATWVSVFRKKTLRIQKLIWSVFLTWLVFDYDKISDSGIITNFMWGSTSKKISHMSLWEKTFLTWPSEKNKWFLVAKQSRLGWSNFHSFCSRLENVPLKAWKLNHPNNITTLLYLDHFRKIIPEFFWCLKIWSP